MELMWHWFSLRVVGLNFRSGSVACLKILIMSIASLTSVLVNKISVYSDTNIPLFGLLLWKYGK